MTLSSSRTLPFHGSDMSSFKVELSVPLKFFLSSRLCRADEVLHQRRDVFAALAQRRDLDVHDVEAVIQIVAKAACFDRFLQVVIGRRNDAHLHLHRRAGADRQDLLGLDRAQQLDLKVERHVGDFIKEDGAAAGTLEEPFLVADGSGEGAAEMAEELALEEGLGDRRRSSPAGKFGRAHSLK